MAPAGLAAFALRTATKSGIYAYEQRDRARFTSAQEKIFRANKAAWKFFTEQPPGYRQILTYWVATAKQDATQQSRLERLIKESAAGRRMR
jgi:uncharacterized protein YdeI (YjbR/CyaY-like superfamily)